MSEIPLPVVTADRRHQSYIMAEDGNVAVRVHAPPLNFGSADNLGENENDEVEIINDLGYNTIGFYCTPPTGGTVIFETSYDGINWEATSIRGVTSDLITSRISVEGAFLGSISTNRAIRFRTEVAGSAPGTVMGVFQREISVIETIEFGHPPHKIGFVTDRHQDAFSTNQTNTILWTPATGKKIVLTELFVFAGGNTDGNMSIFSDTNVNGNIIFKNDIKVSTNVPYSQPLSWQLGLISGVDESIKITTDAAINCNIMLFGYEI